MKEFVYKITESHGLHTRPAELLSKQAAKYKSSITAAMGQDKADVKQLSALMGLEIKTGDVIKFQSEGADEDKASDAIHDFLTEHQY